MSFATHGDRKYLTGERVGDAADWPMLRVERRLFSPGIQAPVTLECNEIVLMVAGRAGVTRTGDGETQVTAARPGVTWLCPEGTYESHIEIRGRMECLHLLMPSKLIGQHALLEYDLDPARAELAYAGGFDDPLLLQVGTAFATVLGRGMQPTDRLFVDGLQAALSAHLLCHYARDRWRPPHPTPTLDPRRLQRVTDFIETRLAFEISLDQLASEACLSPFHFSRLFRDATGLTPHRYVTERRVQVAREKLAMGNDTLVEIALGTGFGSQANFIRVFRKATGLTPGRYRNLHRR